MTKNINYGDDLFALTLLVRGLTDIVKLDADPSFFKDKLASDIFAVDAIMGRISEALGGCAPFVKQKEHLLELLKLKKVFIEFLEEVLLGKAPLSQGLGDYSDKLQRIRDAHRRDSTAIRDALTRCAAVPQEMENMVSQEELKSLLEAEGQN